MNGCSLALLHGLLILLLYYRHNPAGSSALTHAHARANTHSQYTHTHARRSHTHNWEKNMNGCVCVSIYTHTPILCKCTRTHIQYTHACTRTYARTHTRWDTEVKYGKSNQLTFTGTCIKVFENIHTHTKSNTHIEACLRPDSCH